jgi:hypothetical protein
MFFVGLGDAPTLTKYLPCIPKIALRARNKGPVLREDDLSMPTHERAEEICHSEASIHRTPNLV